VLALIDKPGAPQAVVQIGRLALAFDDDRAPAATLANTLLGGSFTSLLNQRLREELAYTYGAASALWRGHGTGTWSISTALKTGNAVDGVREIFAIVDRFVTSPPSDTELGKARQLELQELQSQLASNGGAAFSLSSLAAFSADASWWARWADALRAVTADQVRDVAATLLAREQLYVVVVGDLAVQRDGLAALGLPPAIELAADGEPRAPTP
jgi:zinc protease